MLSFPICLSLSSVLLGVNVHDEISSWLNLWVTDDIGGGGFALAVDTCADDMGTTDGFPEIINW